MQLEKKPTSHTYIFVIFPRVQVIRQMRLVTGGQVSHGHFTAGGGSRLELEIAETWRITDLPVKVQKERIVADFLRNHLSIRPSALREKLVSDLLEFLLVQTIHIIGTKGCASRLVNVEQKVADALRQAENVFFDRHFTTETIVVQR